MPSARFGITFRSRVEPSRLRDWPAACGAHGSRQLKNGDCGGITPDVPRGPADAGEARSSSPSARLRPVTIIPPRLPRHGPRAARVHCQPWTLSHFAPSPSTEGPASLGRAERGAWRTPTMCPPAWNAPSTRRDPPSTPPETRSSPPEWDTTLFPSHLFPPSPSGPFDKRSGGRGDGFSTARLRVRPCAR